MRKYIKYITIVSIFMTISCQKQPYSPDGTDAQSGVISFSSCVNTKAPIIEDLNSQSFGVYGFLFSNTTRWNTAKKKTAPNVFLNQLIENDNNGICSYTYTPIIDANGNTLDYDTLISSQLPWDLNQSYSFFAYYPYSAFNQSNTSIVPSTHSYKEGDNLVYEYGVPYIIYTLPEPVNGQVDPDRLLDIMTARRIDYSATMGTEVRFTFDHRLFCIDIYGHNFTSETYSISNLEMTISGIQYNKYKIYMDKDDKEFISQPSAENWSTDHELKCSIIGDSGVSLSPGAESTPLSRDKNIVLIPQNSSLSGVDGLNVTIDFTKSSIKDGEIVSTDYSLETTYNVDFKEGKKYSITINFTGTDVILVKGEAAAWESKDVTHTFD